MLFYSASSLVGIVYFFQQTTRISPWMLLLVAWRPTLSSLGMIAFTFFIDHLWVSRYPDALQLLRLGILVAAGVFSYAALAWFIWLLCGRPASAEHLLLKTARQQLRGLLDRVRPA